jgi:phosphatidylserine/phosphatidylglycerophosphate/cardiolipin synthase-like enzyme
VGKQSQDIPHEKYPGKRLHVRAMIRDGREAFIGSQSMRKLELDNRREVGIFIKNATVVNELARTFEDDWSLTDSGRRAQKDENAPAEAVAYPQAV